MIPSGQMARLAGRRRRAFRQNLGLFHLIPHAVFGGRIHFPLGMIETGMAGLARLGLPSLYQGKSVACMARIAGGVSERYPGLFQLLYLISKSFLSNAVSCKYL